MKRLFVGPLLRLLYRPRVEGREHVPDTGPVILAGNHLAVIDSFLVPLVLPRQVFYLGKAEYVNGKGLKGRATAAFMKRIGLVPVDRSGGKASEAALQAGLKILDAGGIFGVYPEGTRSPDGRLYRGKTGVARVALASGAPVVPVVMVGTDRAQPAGRVIPKPMSIGIKFGPPLDFTRYQGCEDDRFILRAVTDEIMYAIRDLSGQEYVDVYAATAKARMAAGKKVAEPSTRPSEQGPTANSNAEPSTE